MNQPPLTRRQRRDAERAARAALATPGSGQAEGAVPGADGLGGAVMEPPSRVPAALASVPTLSVAGSSAPRRAASAPQAPATRCERLRQERRRAEREAASSAPSTASALHAARAAGAATQFPDSPLYASAIERFAAQPEPAAPRAYPPSPAPRDPERWERRGKAEGPIWWPLSAGEDAPAMVAREDALGLDALKPFGEPPAEDGGAAAPAGPASGSRRGSDGPTVEIPSSEQPTDTGFEAPGSLEDADAIVPPARARRRTLLGTTSRVAVLAVLAVVTVVAPLEARVLDNGVGSSSAAASAYLGVAAGTPSSVSAGVLGSDADLGPGTDAELSNAPDAATLARIREAYENAAVTCAQRSGASGNTSAFTKTPELFYPMVAGTYELSSDYGYRIHPTLGFQKLHAGQDMAAPVGTPIYAIASGTVVEAGMVDGTGTVTIEHRINGTTWYSSYLHMYADGIYVKKGDTVEAGKLIAGVGSTGYSTGPHLHFEIRTKNDVADSSTVNPWTWLKENKAVALTTDCS
ncbi:peptidoglycan DD-metalloendopeptidase family protein [Actinomyces marmotae]|uniref:peptidoglycan DD-metalloendopeptidase family protein n=1 Tax=Actinomyces marmotae TaxID=2737173 RepID=UPI001F21DFBD|nr:peptidoglycan DD-metalloendopeptidase family protein [Actinomyces marmotae]